MHALVRDDRVVFKTVLHLIATPFPHCAGAAVPCRYIIPFVFSGVFALGDSVWESQPPAVLQSSSFFPDERDRDAAQGSTLPPIVSSPVAAAVAPSTLEMQSL